MLRLVSAPHCIKAILVLCCLQWYRNLNGVDIFLLLLCTFSNTGERLLELRDVDGDVNGLFIVFLFDLREGSSLLVSKLGLELLLLSALFLLHRFDFLLRRMFVSRLSS